MGLFKMQNCRNAYKRAVPSNLFNQFIVSINGFQNVKVIPRSMYFCLISFVIQYLFKWMSGDGIRGSFIWIEKYVDLINR